MGWPGWGRLPFGSLSELFVFEPGERGSACWSLSAVGGGDAVELAGGVGGGVDLVVVGGVWEGEQFCFPLVEPGGAARVLDAVSFVAGDGDERARDLVAVGA
jgi:hypothetical protein